jgi:hypothetical protein
MMILLVTCRSVRQVTYMHHHRIMKTGPHLRTVFERWRETLGTPESPSVEQGLRIICETEMLMSGYEGAANATEEEVDVANSMCAMTRN